MVPSGLYARLCHAFLVLEVLICHCAYVDISDPHVKVCGSKADVMKAKHHILEMFDVKVKYYFINALLHFVQ